MKDFLFPFNIVFALLWAHFHLATVFGLLFGDVYTTSFSKRRSMCERFDQLNLSSAIYVLYILHDHFLNAITSHNAIA